MANFQSQSEAPTPIADQPVSAPGVASTNPPAPQQPESNHKKGTALALIVGIIALLTWWLPVIGLLVGITAIVLGILGLKKATRKGLSIAGIITGLIATILAVIVTVAFVTTVVLNREAINTTQEVKDERKSAQQQLIEGKKDFAKGETANFADTYEVTVNSVVTDFTPAASDEPADGKEFLFLNVTVKNISDKPAFIGPFRFSLNENGTVIDASGAVAPEKIKNGELEPGQSVTGGLAFEITPGAKDLKLVYETTVYDQSLQPQKLVYTLAF